MALKLIQFNETSLGGALRPGLLSLVQPAVKVPQWRQWSPAPAPPALWLNFPLRDDPSCGFVRPPLRAFSRPFRPRGGLGYRELEVRLWDGGLGVAVSRKVQPRAWTSWGTDGVWWAMSQ